MFKFFDKGVLIHSSNSLEEVEKKALEYKQKNRLKLIEIVTGKGKFYKWI